MTWFDIFIELLAAVLTTDGMRWEQDTRVEIFQTRNDGGSDQVVVANIVRSHILDII